MSDRGRWQGTIDLPAWRDIDITVYWTREDGGLLLDDLVIYTPDRLGDHSDLAEGTMDEIEQLILSRHETELAARIEADLANGGGE